MAGCCAPTVRGRLARRGSQPVRPDPAPYCLSWSPFHPRPDAPTAVGPKVPHGQAERLYPGVFGDVLFEVGDEFLAVLEQDALEGQLGGAAGGELDVGRGEQL